MLTWDIAVSVKYYTRIVACSLENWYHYHSENDISNIEDKKKLDIGKKFYAEKKRQDIGCDVKIKNLYSWRNIKMCTIILVIAFFFVVEMLIFYLYDRKDSVLIKDFN